MIILTNGNGFETWGALTEACRAHDEFSYHYLKRKKFPFNYKGFTFIKTQHNTKTL